MNGCRAEYLLRDIRDYEPDRVFDASLLLFGELNAFSRADAARVLANAARALKPGGKLFIELHSRDAVKRLGHEGPHWESLESGLFSPEPHLLLRESFWNESAGEALTRYLIINAESAECTEYTALMTAYAESEYMELFRSNGLRPLSRLGRDEWPAGRDFEGALTTFVCELGMK